MEFLIIGIVSALNLIVIVHKFRKNRVEDGIFDSVLFAVMSIMFSGSYGGMVVAMISSLIISIYLWSSPPKFFKSILADTKTKNTVKDVRLFASTLEPFKASTSKDKNKETYFD